MDPAVAAKGLGEFGRVEIFPSLWDECVCATLLSKYKSWQSHTGGVGGTSRIGSTQMPEAIAKLG